MATARDIVRTALKRIGAQAAGETLSNADDADGFERLNTMIDSWQAERLTIYYVERVVHALTANDGTYTIGSGGNINRARPEYIERAGIVLDSSASVPVEVPIPVINVQRYADIRTKSLTSTYPTQVWYDYNFSSGLATLTLWPVLTGTTVQLVLYLPVALTTFATQTTSYSLPGGYEEALQDNLAIKLAPEWGKPVTDELRRQAMESLGRIKRRNMRVRWRVGDPALVQRSRGGTYNWRTGE